MFRLISSSISFSKCFSKNVNVFDSLVRYKSPARGVIKIHCRYLIAFLTYDTFSKLDKFDTLSEVSKRILTARVSDKGYGHGMFTKRPQH